MTIQEEIKNNATKRKSIRAAIKLINEKTESLARELLAQLRQINDWEAMISEECLWHYEKCPYEFFSWCEVYSTDKEVWFEKGYSNGDEYTALTISLDVPLEEQVRMAIAAKEDKERKETEQEREKELAELERLKKKYESK